MGKVVEEMEAILDGENELLHYGMPRRSGRYPYGSGEEPYQHGRDFLGRVEEMRKSGFTYLDEKTGKVYTGDTAIAKHMGLSTTQFRTEIGLAKDERRMLQVATAKALKKDGLGATEIGRKMGINESTVRSLLDDKSEARMNQSKQTAEFIKDHVDKNGRTMIGVGVERELNISKEKLDQALYILQREGYEIQAGRVEQPTNRGNWTTVNTIAPPGTPYKDLFKDFDEGNISTLTQYISRDDGQSFERKFTYPSSMDPKRIMIRYAEDGGVDKDGVVELRRGVEDLSLGNSNYSQVRIAVNGTHYIKGMAVYANDTSDWPDGVDAVFNTNKTKDKPMLDLDSPKKDKCVLKPLKDDPENPFGSLIKDADQGGQYWYNDSVTGERKLGLINKRADQGDWTEWKDALPAQFLSKQTLSMAKKQLGLASAQKMAEFEEICSINNPTIKKHFLQKFADECDSAAVHLQAAALPGQKYHVIIPNNTLKDNEIYAPGYPDGTQLALIRYPHAGTFEIPLCKVNNKNKVGKELIGPDSIDAVCVNKAVADRLSGADFDGDTVMCIPTHDPAGKVRVKSTHELTELKGFDPKLEYPERPGMKYMKDPVTGKDSTQLQMGVISNLITDMTLAGADEHKMARAVKHSMVVIDAAKHKLDYKQSEIDNNIAALKKEYQSHVDENGRVHVGGASTLISKSKGETSVIKRQGNPVVDPETGKITWKVADDAYYVDRKNNRDDGTVTVRLDNGKKITYNPSNKEEFDRYNPTKHIDPVTKEVTYTNPAGDITYRTKTRKQQSTKMAETDDAYSLLSDARHPMEILYADYANGMKALANKSRKEKMATGKIKYDANAAKIYSEEVNSLIKDKLNTALLNAPRERYATLQTHADIESRIKAVMDANPGMDRKTAKKAIDMKKASQQSLTRNRQEVGAVKRSDRSIKITDREWEAIQAGAISETKLKQILDNTDVDELRARATPRTSTTLTPAKISTIKAMSASNYSLAQIADKLGVPTSTVYNYMKGGN